MVGVVVAEVVLAAAGAFAGAGAGGAGTAAAAVTLEQPVGTVETGAEQISGGVAAIQIRVRRIGAALVEAGLVAETVADSDQHVAVVEIDVGQPRLRVDVLAAEVGGGDGEGCHPGIPRRRGASRHHRAAAGVVEGKVQYLGEAAATEGIDIAAQIARHLGGLGAAHHTDVDHFVFDRGGEGADVGGSVGAVAGHRQRGTCDAAGCGRRRRIADRNLVELAVEEVDRPQGQTVVGDVDVAEAELAHRVPRVGIDLEIGACGMGISAGRAGEGGIEIEE